MCGISEYVLDIALELHSLVYVRENLKRRKRVEFSLCEKEILEDKLAEHEVAIMCYSIADHYLALGSKQP